MEHILDLWGLATGYADIEKDKMYDFSLFLCRIRDDWEYKALEILYGCLITRRLNLASTFLLAYRLSGSNTKDEVVDKDEPILVDLIKRAMDNFSLSPECYSEDDVKGFLDYIFTIRIYSRWCDSIKDIYNAAPEYVKTLFAKKYISVFGGFEA